MNGARVKQQADIVGIPWRTCCLMLNGSQVLDNEQVLDCGQILDDEQMLNSEHNGDELRDSSN